MERIAAFIVNHRKAIIVVFVVLTLVCAPLALLVKVNYNLIDYLPAAAPSTTAIELMGQEFDEPIPNAEVMINDVTLLEAQEWKERLAAVPGVSSVGWLDDVIDLKQPLALADQATIENFFKDNTARYNLVLTESAVPLVEELIGPDNALAGEAPSTVAVQGAAVNEVTGAFAILIPAIIILLALFTSSWIEPFLLLVTIGVSIVINMGTNFVFGEISFITNSVSPILQLAVSLDYAIFLLHAFADQRKVHADAKDAMRSAVRISFSTIASSGATTLFGFLALAFMAFLIGADLGINLAKGIIFSFITSMIFLPALTLGLYKVMDRTTHRPLMPSFRGVHKVLLKLAIPVTILVMLALVPSYLGQSRTAFLYGTESAGSGTRAALDAEKISEEFGTSTPVIVLVPRGDVARETELGQALLELDHVTGLMSYASTVGAELPPVLLEREVIGQFYSKDYARLIVYTDTATEGATAFDTVERISETTQRFYPENSYLLGRSATLYDMMHVVQSDNTRINLIAIAAIFLVLLIAFRSLILPFILLVTIESAIWINLAIPYFADTSINYIGYLVLSTVQLGATVDYAILLTSTYMRFRKDRPKGQAVREALGTSFKSILVSATVLSLAGFTLFFSSSNAIVQDIGQLLGRGTLLSFLMVVIFLPALLLLFDPLIKRLTIKSEFFNSLSGNTSPAHVVSATSYSGETS
ncbi:MAG: MMPL family transporter [Coriobacteriales bacterium]|jgi:predicted RND superfamily exporter protein|nr:MMPL family transporter [Coriobacteriales bacterium]